MSTDDLDVQKLVSESQQIDSHDFRDPDDDDNYVSMALYLANDGRHFRYIEMSGMNSSWSGAGEIVEWLDGASLDSWKIDF